MTRKLQARGRVQMPAKNRALKRFKWCKNALFRVHGMFTTRRRMPTGFPKYATYSCFFQRCRKYTAYDAFKMPLGRSEAPKQQDSVTVTIFREAPPFTVLPSRAGRKLVTVTEFCGPPEPKFFSRRNLRIYLLTRCNSFMLQSKETRRQSRFDAS